MINEYVILEQFPKYQINREGQIRNIKTNKILKQTIGTNGYLSINLNNNDGYKCLRVHRLIATVYIQNPDNKLCVDHINHNITDNSIDNLRWCTPKENARNKRKTNKPKSSMYKGVSMAIGNNKWRVFICGNNGMNQHVGYYDTDIEAARAYNIRATELYGEYASLNIIA